MFTAEMTTAAALGALRKELIEEGFPKEEAFEIVMEYARAQSDNGFGVKDPAKAVTSA